MAHFQWRFRNGDKVTGSASFLEEACRFNGAPVIWADVRPVGGGFELNLWGVRLHPERSHHKSKTEAYEAAERYAERVLKRFLKQKLAALDAERAETVRCILHGTDEVP